MSSEQIPLGQKESQRLEFKGRDALQDRFKIGREVVGMLNAEGGEIWIGLAEDGGRAVRVEPIEKPEIERRALRDFLVDTIEPPLSSKEIEILIVPDNQGGGVLKIQVQPEANRQPYALLRKNLRDFRLRIDERLRPMSREEIFQRARDASQKEGDRREALAAAIAKVQATRDKVKRFPKGTFWLQFKPVDELSVDVRDPIFHELVEDPTLTGNRRTGWHFARASETPSLAKGQVRWFAQYFEDLAFEVTAHRSGALSFRAGLPFFHHDGEENQLWPYSLVEYPISAFRIAGFIYREQAVTSPPVVADSALLGANGWGLRPGRPKTYGFLMASLKLYEEAQDLTWDEPLVFDMTEIQDEPDRCGFRLVRRIYEAFGYPETEIPFFDRDTGRLVLPE